MKRSSRCIYPAALIAILLVARTGVAQEKPATQEKPVTQERPAATQERPAAQLIPLKIQLVISRNAGEKKISSQPYSLWVTANNQRDTQLRMGVDVPVPTRVTTTPAGVASQDASYNYRPVGTNIDCSATTTPDGWFNVSITLSDSAVRFDSKETGAAVAGVPTFRNFTSRFSILLKDGQTAQYTSATDPVTGEVLKVDVTLNVLK